MKREKLFTALWAVVLSFFLSFSAVGGLVSAFSMAVSYKTLALVCLGAAVMGVVCYTLPLGLFPPGALVIGLGYFWNTGGLVHSVESLLYRLSKQYHQGYGWPVIRWSGRVAEELETTMPLILCLLGVVIAFLICRGICRKKSVVIPVCINLLCLCACFVVNDTVPGNLFLYLQLLSLVVLLLTAGVRRESLQGYNQLMLIATPITALALLILFACVPRQTYTTERADKLQNWVMRTALVQTILNKTQPDAGALDGSIEDLTRVGYNTAGKNTVFTLKADYTDTLYLRGRALDSYDGVSWTQGENTAIRNLNWPVELQQAGAVEITTKYAHRMLYVPYYPASLSMRSHDGVVNGQQLTQYSFVTQTLRTDKEMEVYWADNRGLYLYMEQAVSLPEAVQEWAKPIAVSLTGETTNVYQQAKNIAAYVRNSAVYDTDTPRMPARHQDFAQWFLDSSDTGYCIHFATATTVLLQAAGIPARYVTGYMVQAVAGQTVEVTADMAHAWCEYWLPGFGWMVLESTPADLRSESAEPSIMGETVALEVPEQTRPDNLPNQVEEPRNGSMLAGILFAVLLGLATWAQYTLRVYLRKRELCRGTINRQALSWWQYAQKLAQLLGECPEETLYDLAQKAKFSQYELTGEEIAEFENYALRTIKRLKTKNLFVKLYHRVIFAAY